MPLYYSQPEIVETIANKRKQREAFKKWEESNVIMVLKLKQTPFKNFRKNVTVHITNKTQCLYNQNNKMGVLYKYRTGLTNYDLKRA